jgi:hypothetical protein
MARLTNAMIPADPYPAEITQISGLAHPLQFDGQGWSRGPDRRNAMYDREFFGSKLGAAALVSIAAMVSFNAYALTQQLDQPATITAVEPAVELA